MFVTKKTWNLLLGGGGRVQKKKKQSICPQSSCDTQSNLDWQDANSCNGMTTEEQNNERGIQIAKIIIAGPKYISI